MRATIIGGGVIGGGWAARFLLNGWDVAMFDPDPEAERKIGDVLANARHALPALYNERLPNEGKLHFFDDLETAVAGSDWVQESVPERLDLKQQIYQRLMPYIDADMIVASSTSGFRPTQLQEGLDRPDNLLVAHPFNPVYLLPLVELVPSSQTSPTITKRAQEILAMIGMKPLLVRKEIDAHIADRLLEAVWRESLWLVKDGVASTEEIDDAIRYGFGLRWAQMGLFETYRIAGGEAGMRHFLAQFGPALAWPWTKLMDVPDLTEALIDEIAAQSDAQSGQYSIRELERIRDDNLVGMMRALRKNNWGAGEIIAAHEASLPIRTQPEDAPYLSASRTVPPSWVDYNGHMNETHYLEVFSNACDEFLAYIGVDADYVAGQHSYFTLETHLRHLDEVQIGAHLRVSTQIIGNSTKTIHLFHEMHNEDGQIAASCEQLMVHVDLKSRKSSPPLATVAEKLAKIAQAHAKLPMPAGVSGQIKTSKAAGNS